MAAGQVEPARGGSVSLWAETRALWGVVLCAASFGLGYWIRYDFVEPEIMGAACERGNPWWCPLRTGFIMFTQLNGFGWLALLLAVGGVLALIGRRAGLAWVLAFVALIVAGFGMILYNNTMSTPAAVIALLCLIRAR